MDIDDIKKISEVIFNITSLIAVVIAAYLTSKKPNNKRKNKGK